MVRSRLGDKEFMLAKAQSEQQRLRKALLDAEIEMQVCECACRGGGHYRFSCWKGP